MMYYLAGTVMIITGICIIYTVGKRRFNRRGPGGLQHFNSYGNSLITRTFELIFKWVGIALILGGIGTMSLGSRLGH